MNVKTGLKASICFSGPLPHYFHSVRSDPAGEMQEVDTDHPEYPLFCVVSQALQSYTAHTGPKRAPIKRASLTNTAATDTHTHTHTHTVLESFLHKLLPQAHRKSWI